MEITKTFKGFIIGTVCAFVISGSLIILFADEITAENEINYNNRFYKEGLADFLMLQLYMFPFNNSDIVTLENGGYGQIIYINHTVPKPEFLPMRMVYNFTMNLDYKMTWQEGNN